MTIDFIKKDEQYFIKYDTNTIPCVRLPDEEEIAYINRAFLMYDQMVQFLMSLKTEGGEIVKTTVI